MDKIEILISLLPFKIIQNKRLLQTILLMFFTMMISNVMVAQQLELNSTSFSTATLGPLQSSEDSTFLKNTGTSTILSTHNPSTKFSFSIYNQKNTTCEFINNGTFASNLNGWAAGSGWFWQNSGRAQNESDGVSNRDLSQTLTGVSAGNLTLSMTLGALNVGGGSNYSATLEVWLGGEKYAEFVNPTSPASSPTISGSSFGGAIIDGFSLVAGNASYNSDDLTITIPNYSGSSTPTLTFRFSATGDDFYVDNIDLIGNCAISTPFNCNAELAYQIIGNPSELYSVNITTGVKTLLLNATTLGNRNLTGLGYNPLDNYLYASVTGTGDIVKIGQEGISTVLKAGLPTISTYIAGAISPSGIMYLYTSNTGTIQRFDLSTGTLLSPILISGASVQDIVISNDVKHSYLGDF